MTKLLAPLALAAVALSAGCSGRATGPAPSAAPVAVHVAAARGDRFAQKTDLAGTLASSQDVTLGAASAGRIVSVEVRVGDRVSAGQIIAQVDAAAYGAALAGARAGEAAAVDSQRAAAAQLAQAQSRYQLARTTAERMANLYAQGAISRQQQDESQASVAAARAGVDQAQAGLGAARGLSVQAEAGVTAAGVPLTDATVTAPFAGLITKKFVEPGAVVGAGSPVASLENTTDLELDVALPEDQAAGIRQGMPLAVRVDALDGAIIPGSLRAVVPSNNPALRSVTLRVTLAPHQGLLPGMFARVSVPGVAQRGVGVPVSALVTRAGQAGVFVVRSGTARFIPVQSGVIDGNTVEVQGLSAGVRVADTNVAQLTDGAAVSVTNP
jgi:multidrug efflux pump subunit AcrA (membrane-fusion protein)